MLLFLFAATITLAVAWFLARPLLRPQHAPAGADAFNATVYRDQLEEVRRDVERGALAAPEAAAARIEIERRLIAAGAHAPDGAGKSAVEKFAKAPKVVAGAVGAGVFVAAAALYLTLGQPGAPDQPLRARADAGAAIAGGDEMHAQMDDLVRQLATKLEESPDDATGWALMARSLMRLERTEQALDAYKRAINLTDGTDGALAAEYAEARVIANDGAVDPEAQSIFEHMLRVEPNSPQARYYLALARTQRGDVAGALRDWRALLADTPAQAPWRETLERQIATAEGRPPPAPSAAPPARGPTAADVAAAGDMAPADRAAMIEGMVTQLAGRLEDNPNDLDGWRRLARAYGVLDRKADAVRAHQRVLALAPDDRDALWALGLDAKERGDNAAARRRWQALEKALPPNAPERAQVTAAIATLPR